MIIKSWGWLTVAGIIFLLLAPALLWFVVNLVRSNRGDILATMPLVREQEINLPSAGEMLVLVETPRMASDYGDFQIDLMEMQGGRHEALKYSYINAQGMINGVSTLKVPFGRITDARAGVYMVRVTGLEPGKNYSGYHLLISRPYLARMAFQIIGIVFCSVVMLLCVIWAAWLAGLMKQPYPPDAGVPGRTIDLETWKRQQQPPPK